MQYYPQSATAEFKLPLVTVRPECAGILRDVPMDEPKLSPASHSVSPYFMENADPDKFTKKGERVLYNDRRKIFIRPLCDDLFVAINNILILYVSILSKLTMFTWLFIVYFKSMLFNWCLTLEYIILLSALKYGGIIHLNQCVSLYNNLSSKLLFLYFYLSLSKKYSR